MKKVKTFVGTNFDAVSNALAEFIMYGDKRIVTITHTAVYISHVTVNHYVILVYTDL